MRKYVKTCKSLSSENCLITFSRCCRFNVPSRRTNEILFLNIDDNTKIKVVKIEILGKIGERSQDHKSGDRNTDRKILPNSQIYIYMPINSCICIKKTLHNTLSI